MTRSAKQQQNLKILGGIYINSTLVNCPFCNHPERTSLENQLLKGQLTKREVAEQILHCRVDEVYEHMTEHLVKQPLVQLGEKRNVLLDSLDKLNDSISVIAQDRNYGPVATKQMVALAAEIRHTITDLNALEGNRAAEQHITIQEYNDFRSVIVAKIHLLCPKCQKILLGEIEKEANDTIIEVGP